LVLGHQDDSRAGGVCQEKESSNTDADCHWCNVPQISPRVSMTTLYGVVQALKYHSGAPIYYLLALSHRNPLC
jgi:hypothetical protein